MPETISSEIRQRQDFAMLADARGLNIAVEIGVDRGHNARRFLERWHGYLLYAVDTWEPYVEMPWDREADFAFAVHALAPFGDRCRIVRATSEQAAKWLKDPIDFVYLDGAHDHFSVRADIAAWWPRLSARGILAGDDFDTEHGGVMDEVRSHAKDAGREVYLTIECGKSPSWYIYKNEPESLIQCAYRD